MSPFSAPIFVLALALQATASAPDPLFGDNRTFRCQFMDSAGRSWKGSTVESRAGEKFSDDIIFDNVNYVQKTARLIGNAGADDATVVDGQRAVTFLTFTDSGGLVATTVFKQRVTVGFYRAAMARHLSLSTGELTAMQFYGRCRGTF